MKNMSEIDLSGKRVLIREDLNVPIKDGKVTSDKRIVASLPTIKQALEAGAAVMVMSHLGRPKEGVFDSEYSLKPVADYIQGILSNKVRFESDWIDGIELEPGELVILENVRFNQGEKSDDEKLAEKMAKLCDVFVMDAFGSAHRAHASTHGVARFAPIACAGPLLTAELEALGKALENPARPMVAIVGGAKVSSKLTVLKSLSKIVDQLIVGGGIANTFIAACGYSVGKSLYEPDLVALAKELMDSANDSGVSIPVPTDVVCGKEFSEAAEAELKRVDAVSEDDMIFDIGPETAETLAALLRDAGTIIWNGPVGVFELKRFAEGTRSLAQAIAESNAFTLAGGGDTLAAIDQCQIEDKLSYISTGGGAFLEFLEGKELPAVKVLNEKDTNT